MKQRAILSFFYVTLILIALCLCTDSFSQDEPFLQSNTTKYQLDNGLTVILKQDRRTPTFFAGIYVRAGSATEEEYSGSGITHLIEHMIFKGTSTMTAEQIARQVKASGASIGAYTTLDYTAFTMQGPADGIAALTDIFYDIISDPQFDKDELEKEKNVIRTEMRYVNDNPQKYLSAQFWQTAYVVHPYRNPIIGYIGIFDALNRDDVKKYYDKFYVPNNMVLVIVGDIDIEAVKGIINTSFAQLKRKSLAASPLAQEPMQIAPRTNEIEYPTSKSYMLMGFHSVSLSDRDIFALDTLSVILGTGRSSLLHEEMYNRQNLVYNIDAYNYTPFHPGLFLIGATFEPENRHRVADEILNIIEGIKKATIKKKEIDKAKNQVMSSYILSRQTQASLGADLGISQLLTGDTDFSAHYLEGIKSVTADDIHRVINKYIRKDNMTKIYLVPNRTAKEPQEPAKTEDVFSRKPTRHVFANGVRLLLTEDKTLPIASIQVCIKGGLYVENKNNNGISNIVSQMLLKGTAGRSEEDIFYLVESAGGSLSAYSGNNSFGLSMEIMSQDIRKGIDILTDVLLRPAFGKDKLRVLKDDVLAQIALKDDDVFAFTEKQLRKKLFPESPYGMMLHGSPESIKNITRKDIINFYRNYCVGSNVVISICGDIDIEALPALIESRLRGIKNRQPVKTLSSELPPLDKRIEILNAMDKEQAVVMAGFRSPGIEDPERYPLQILSSIYSGHAGRLYENIRQRKAMAYTLGVFGMTGIDTGSFIFYSAASDENIELITQAIFEEIKLVNEGAISQEDMDSARKSLVSQYQIGLQTAGAFAQKIALDELYGLGYKHYLLYPEIINQISRDQVVQLSNKYFNTNACVVSRTTSSKYGNQE
jgi:zinc protease